jgi:broad specificity polyphosphatase/5'/3'-nucleotidase SurE
VTACKAVLDRAGVGPVASLAVSAAPREDLTDLTLEELRDRAEQLVREVSGHLLPEADVLVIDVEDDPIPAAEDSIPTVIGTPENCIAPQVPIPEEVIPEGHHE